MKIFTFARGSRDRKPEQKHHDHFDENDSEESGEEIFDRRERLSNLKEGRFATDRNTIFSAILEELKNKAEKKT